MLIFSWFLCGILYFFLYSYLFCKIVLKTKYKVNKKNMLFALVLGITNTLSLYFDVGYLKPYVFHTMIFIGLYIIYNEKFIKTVLVLIFILILSFIGELLFGVIFVLVLNINFEMANKIWYILLFSNISILIITLLLSKISFVNKFFNNVIEWHNKNEYKSVVIFLFLIVTILTFFLYNNFINVLPKSLLLLTNLFCVSIFTIIIGYFKEKTNKNRMIYEYDQLLDYVKTYENLLDEKNKTQHEYKNQLAVIRVMTKDKKIINYVDSLLQNEIEENLETINKLKYIPKGGLKGLIYYKIETMKKKKINVFIDVSSELINHKLWKKCDLNLQTISKILGVYLDNSIEASIESKEKIVSFEVYLEDKNIVFEISNTFINKINIDKIDEKGYSTKGKNRGYGLSLVKDLIDKSDYIVQQRKIIGNYYIQKLIIKK